MKKSSWKEEQGGVARTLTADLLSSGFTVTPCAYPTLQGNEAFGGGHQRHHYAVVSPPVCSCNSPGLAERMGKLLTTIARQRKLLTVKPLALKTEIAFEICEEIVCH